MTKVETDNHPRRSLLVVLYDRISSWLVFFVSLYLFSRIEPNMLLRSNYVYAGQLMIGGILAFIASILLENRARRK
ncbi:hypothetical protein [Bremerella sp.]|uniref:hypothetical protein n=1 Tax=Bremerella sp. TaxID=2795602 RepID=UPI00391ABE50